MRSGNGSGVGVDENERESKKKEKREMRAKGGWKKGRGQSADGCRSHVDRKEGIILFFSFSLALRE